MLKLRKDFKCILRDKMGEDLLEFDAQQVTDPSFNVGFEGGGVASWNQSLTIMTEAAYDYNALQQHVIIDGKKWLITNVSVSMRRKLGAGMGAKTRAVYIIALE